MAALPGNHTPKLTEAKRQKIEQFVDLYRGGPDKLRGSALACYQQLYPRATKGTARRRSHELFMHPYTQHLLEARANESLARADIKQDEVIREIARIAFFDPRKLFNDDGEPLPINKLDDATAAAINGIKVNRVKLGDDDSESSVIEYKISNKNDALEKLMKHLGLYQQDNEQKTQSLAEALTNGIKRISELGE